MDSSVDVELRRAAASQASGAAATSPVAAPCRRLEVPPGACNGHAHPDPKDLRRAASRQAGGVKIMDWRQAIEAQRKAKDDAFRMDPGSPIMAEDRRSFKGLAYFPPDPRYRFEAALVAEPRKVLDIQRSGGDIVRYVRLGHFAIRLPHGDVKLALYESD